MPQQPILNEILRQIPRVNADWEVFYLKKDSFSVEGKDSTFDKRKISTKSLFSIRVLKDQKPGFSTCVEIEKIPDALSSALLIAENSDPDDFIQFPDSEDISNVETFDEELKIAKESIIDLLLEMQDGAFSDKRIKKIRNAEVKIVFEERGIVNSKGLKVSYPSTQITAHIIAVAEEKDSQIGWSYRAERFLRNMDFKSIGLDAATKALMLLNAEKISTFKGFVLLNSAVATEFLELIAQSLSGENYLLGKSIFINKINEQVINEKVEIIDDGLMPEKFGSAPFDGEGVPTKHKILIERGILKNLMHNTYTAKRFGLPSSSGNAVRTDRGITVGPTNLYIDSNEPKYSLDELISLIDRGVYVLDVMGMHTANPVSGDFSVGVAGVLVEGGKIKNPVKEVVISGNIGDLFTKVKALGNDLTFYGNLGAPSLLIEGIDISG